MSKGNKRPLAMAAWAATMLAAACALSACGGGGGSDDDDSGSGGSATPPTAGQAATICSGSGSATLYDVYFPGAYGITRAARATEVHGSASAAEQCIAVAASTAQADSAQFQAVTTDAWADAISYFDPSATSVAGGIRLNQKLFITCQSNSDAVKHLAVLSSGRVATDVFGSTQAANVARSVGFQSYGCVQDSTGVHAGNGSAVATFASDGSLTVKDSGSTVLTVAAADVPALFSDSGYAEDGEVFRWQLYQLPVDGGSKQVIVHTVQKASGGYGVLAFIQP
ncbi:hypothetical protein CKO44_03720 [Rubrivivax gelatinosus]|uniref:hypothetical protein n=1 Tax=Rubrivivax gelatinosus TaxID=28068 RepID=UPI00190593A2|nr:hypothetical protein [Rubrivivax gelatinosus]MBK1612571.1 hypothetical protein [Rubrivivax gelatinosus]